MKITLISNILLVAASLTQVPSRGIVGGDEVGPKFRYPWIVSLQFYGVHSCGGTLYNKKSIITAAHCVVGLIDHWTANIHRHDLSKSSEQENGFSYKVLERDFNKFYNKAAGNINDISVWKISGEGLRPQFIKLDDGTISYQEGKILTVIGWGRTSINSKTSPVLRQLEVPIYNATECEETFTTYRNKLQFCAGYQEGKRDSCKGDSGGPIFTYEKGIVTLVGVVSWGRGCAFPNHPGIYTRVSNYLAYIKDNA